MRKEVQLPEISENVQSGTVFSILVAVGDQVEQDQPLIELESEKATVEVGGNLYRAGLQMIDDVQPGDYVLLHAGFAIQKISDREAQETLQLLREMGELD